MNEIMLASNRVTPVALQPQGNDDIDMPAVLRQLQWGTGWLEVLVHRIAALRVDLHSDEGARLLQVAYAALAPKAVM